MEKSKLIAALMTFERPELFRLKQFVESPYFNKNQEVIQLYEYLRVYAPHFPNRKIRKENVYHKIFPGRDFDRQHLNHLMNYLLKLVERFLSIEKFSEQPVKGELELLASCIDRKLDQHYQRYEKRATALLEQQKQKDQDYYFFDLKMADLTATFFHNQSIRPHDYRLQVLADRLDIFYLVSKLKYSCAMLDRKNSMAVEYEVNFIQDFEHCIPESSFYEHPAIRIYYLLYSMLREEEHDHHYQQFREWLDRHQDGFSREDVQELYYWAINYCIRKVRSGNRRFIEELLQLYLTGIEETILLENDQLSPWTFKNIVKLGLGTKRFDWTENFVKTYLDKLPPSFREDALHYNMANLHFIRKEYDQAGRHLNQVEFKDIYYLLDSKVLLLKIYYEECEIEPMLALAQSFKVFLRRNKVVTSNVKTVYQNFIKILLKLTRVYKDGNAEELIGKIESMGSLTDREWLLEKAAYYRKKMPDHRLSIS